ncbi:unnamed protein product, partial [Sphacelaria rigidula]
MCHRRCPCCYGTAKSINCSGQGVQVRPEACFTEACCALWPRKDLMSVEKKADGSQQENRKPSLVPLVIRTGLKN